jgi:hypothetical protein
MKVYIAGEKPARQASFIMSIAPAATTSGEVPSNWVDDKNNPVQFNIEFIRGEAEVEDSIGRYLLENELARKSRLILPRELNDDELLALQLQQPHGG